MAEKLTIVRSHAPTLELATLAQPIGLAAWQDRMPKRGSDIRHTFNPENPRTAEKLFNRMNEKSGQFVGAVAYVGERAVGYSLVHDDMSRNVFKKPYAWVAQINVLPEYQKRGIGSLMIETVLDPFAGDQKPTAYVFGENALTLAWFKRRGFAARPADPAKKHDYFGEQADPVDQYRLEAPSVESAKLAFHDFADDVSYDFEIIEN